MGKKTTGLKDVEDYVRLALDLDQMIKDGKGEGIRGILTSLKEAKMPRQVLVDFAHLARRVNLPLLSILWLSPIVRPKFVDQEPATFAEQVAYAGSLTRLGFVTEAQELLQKIPGEIFPEVWLYQALTHMSQWEYRQAIAPLKKLIRVKDFNAYQILLAKINLSAALVAVDKWDEAEHLLEELREETVDHKLLRGNCMEISAQAAILKGDYFRAEVYLKKGEELLSTEGGLSDLLLRKWKALLCLHRDGLSDINRERILDVRQRAVRIRSYETVRDCDFYRALYEGDSHLYAHVFFGTPYAIFRRRMIKAGEDRIRLPEFYNWDPGHFHETEATLGFLQSSRLYLEPWSALAGQDLLGKLLEVLASDFYRPTNLWRIFNSLYPGEYFDPWSSPGRVSRLVQRFRQWCRDNRVPWEIQTINREMTLVSSTPYALKIHQRPHQENSLSLLMRRLIENFHDKSFTAAEVARILRISHRSSNRLIGQGIELEKIQKFGQGRGILYRIAG